MEGLQCDAHRLLFFHVVLGRESRKEVEEFQTQGMAGLRGYPRIHNGGVPLVLIG